MNGDSQQQPVSPQDDSQRRYQPEGTSVSRPQQPVASSASSAPDQGTILIPDISSTPAGSPQLEPELYTAADPAITEQAAQDSSLPHEATWTASEFIAHEKGVSWYGIMIAGSVVLAALVYVITRDVFSVGIIVVVAVLFAVAAGRKPRVLSYRVDAKGLMIEQKFYPYNEFKSFAVIQEGAFSSISFLPLKRFMPSLSIYYDPDHEDLIATIIAQHLPYEHREADMLDRAIRHMRF